MKKIEKEEKEEKEKTNLTSREMAELQLEKIRNKPKPIVTNNVQKEKDIALKQINRLKKQSGLLCSESNNPWSREKKANQFLTALKSERDQQGGQNRENTKYTNTKYNKKSNTTKTLTVLPEDTVEAVKEYIRKKRGIPSDQQNLVFKNLPEISKIPKSAKVLSSLSSDLKNNIQKFKQEVEDEPNSSLIVNSILTQINVMIQILITGGELTWISVKVVLPMIFKFLIVLLSWLLKCYCYNKNGDFY